MRLEPEQIDLLRELATAAREAPRENRLFCYVPTLGALLLEGPIQKEISESEAHDLRDLAAAGLLRIRRRNVSGEFDFTVSPEAHDFLAQQQSVAPLASLENEILGYLDDVAFGNRYPEAYSKWKEAASLLWGLKPETELTTIGHKSREAVQEFAAVLVRQEGLQDVVPNPAHTVARLQAIIEHNQDRLGEARQELLDALICYWGEVNDLLQRQEHGGQKEGEPLSWEDGRRAVFQSAIAMYEIDRALARFAEP